MWQQEVINSVSHPYIDSAPVVVPQKPGGARLTIPVLGGLCCLGLILLFIASTIVLALIPIYLKERDTALAQRTQVSVIRLPASTTLQTGSLNEAQRQTLQTGLQSQLNTDSNTKGVTIRVVEATALAGTRRKRQTAATSIQATIIISGPSRTVASAAASLNNQFVLSQATTTALESQGNTVIRKTK